MPRWPPRPRAYDPPRGETTRATSGTTSATEAWDASLARVLFALLVIALIEILDYSTGPYMTFELLYFIPIAWLAWTTGPIAGVLAAVLAIGGEFLLDWAWPQIAGVEIYAWNTFTRTSVLAAGAVAVARIRHVSGQLAESNDRLNTLLAAEARAHDDTQRRFGLVVDALEDYAIVLFGEDGRATGWSASTPRIIGRAHEELEGRRFEELFPPSEHPDTASLPPTEERLEVERWTLTGRQQRYWANILLYPLGGGHQREHLAIVRDATGRKVAEEALRRARDEAVAAMRELESFSYTVAHDLRAPLRAIDGFGALLETEATDRLSDAGKARLFRIRQAARRGGRLIDDLLEMTRLGQAPVRRIPVDITETGRGIDRHLRESSPDRNVEFSAAEGLTAVADPQLVAVVLRNLLDNAWKFTSKRPVAHIELGRVEAQDPTFFVRDDGVGFDMAYVDRLFRPFERLHRVDEFEGTGIGLATVRRIVERHGGRVWAEGAPDQGATVYFTLPEPLPAEAG